MGASIFDRAKHRLLNGQLRPPTQGANARTVQEYEGTVADPAALAARVGKPGTKTEMLANPADGIVDFTILVGPEIKDVHLGLGSAYGGENRIDTVLNGQL